MEMRSNRYNSESENNKKLTRVERNKHLYDESNIKIDVDNISNYENGSKIDLTTLKNAASTRGDYQKIKEYKNIFRENDNVENDKSEIKEKEKNFDINAVLEEAKKNRTDEDELEKKRKLNSEEYNVLSNLNKKYLHKKNFTEEDGEELKELIDTITSKTLVDDIKNADDKGLLSDLLATTIDIKLEKELSKEDFDKIYSSKSKEDEGEETFYTHSMEIDKNDLINEDEEEEEDDSDLFEDINTTSGVKIFIIVFVILIILSILAYFVLKKLGISL